MSALIQMEESMVDAMVVAYGTTKPLPTQLEHLEHCQASIALLRRLDQVRVPAVAWAEFKVGTKNINEQFLQEIGPKLHFDEFSGAAAEYAADLLIRRRNGSPKVCSRCLGSLKSGPCPGCNNHRSYQERVNDAFIVATAATTPGIVRLFSFDPGVHAFARLVNRSDFEIMRPPSPHGEFFDIVNATVSAEHQSSNETEG